MILGRTPVSRACYAQLRQVIEGAKGVVDRLERQQTADIEPRPLRAPPAGEQGGVRQARRRAPR